jgi:copper chaperone CopZ
MIRRQFLKLASLASATGLSSIGVVEALRAEPQTASGGDLRKVIWHVHGFTCVTCAVGLEVVLGRQAGVASVHATYPQGLVTVQFDPSQVKEDALRAAIAEMGFRVTEQAS